LKYVHIHTYIVIGIEKRSYKKSNRIISHMDTPLTVMVAKVRVSTLLCILLNKVCEITQLEFEMFHIENKKTVCLRYARIEINPESIWLKSANTGDRDTLSRLRSRTTYIHTYIHTYGGTTTLQIRVQAVCL
jgi:hypothetical protein